jgi:hypothetical protein
VLVDAGNRVVEVGGDPGVAPDGHGLATSAVPVSREPRPRGRRVVPS